MNAVCSSALLQAVNNREGAAHQHLRRTGNPHRKFTKTPAKALRNLGELEVIGGSASDKTAAQHAGGDPERTSTAGGSSGDADLQSQLIPATESETTEPSAAPKPDDASEMKEEGIDREGCNLGCQARVIRPRQWNRSFADVRRTRALSTAAR